MVASVIAENAQPSFTAMTPSASTSSISVGPMLNTTLRIRKSVDREPRSMTRESVPICLDWWKSRPSESACCRLSTAALAIVDWETRMKIASRR